MLQRIPMNTEDFWIMANNGRLLRIGKRSKDQRLMWFHGIQAIFLYEV